MYVENVCLVLFFGIVILERLMLKHSSSKIKIMGGWEIGVLNFGGI
jgi:hypothetical protein